jgi:hypothetical protein
MDMLNRNVRVILIDDRTGTAFATTERPAANLPESFEIETTLHLGDTDWSVVHAQPRTRPEYARSGSLTLRLRRVEKVDLSKILFSLPSICDRLAAVGEAPLSGDECILHEDDWRQLELVSRSFAPEADAEIAAIRQIHEQERVEVGWRKLHVRRRPDPPIDASLTLKDVDRAFGGGVTFRGVSYRGARSPIVSGYSFRAADGLLCYGVEEYGRVKVLGIGQVASASSPIRSASSLAEIAKEFDLDLIDWCRCARASWDSPLFRYLLLGGDVEPDTTPADGN